MRPGPRHDGGCPDGGLRPAVSNPWAAASSSSWCWWCCRSSCCGCGKKHEPGRCAPGLPVSARQAPDLSGQGNRDAPRMAADRVVARLSGLAVPHRLRGGQEQAPPPRGSPALYSPVAGGHCTSWTFFGTVGQASGPLVAGAHLPGPPMLVFLFGWRLLARLILVAKREHHLHRRLHCRPYGKSQRLAMVISLIAVMGILPYLVLQLKAIVTGLDLLMANSAGGPPATWRSWRWASPCCWPVQHTVRHPQPGCHRTPSRGMVVAIAFESVVKLLAFMAVGASRSGSSSPGRAGEARTLVASDFLEAGWWRCRRRAACWSSPSTP